MYLTNVYESCKTDSGHYVWPEIRGPETLRLDLCTTRMKKVLVEKRVVVEAVRRKLVLVVMLPVVVLVKSKTNLVVKTVEEFILETIIRVTRIPVRLYVFHRLVSHHHAPRTVHRLHQSLGRVVPQMVVATSPTNQGVLIFGTAVELAFQILVQVVASLERVVRVLRRCAQWFVKKIVTDYLTRALTVAILRVAHRGIVDRGFPIVGNSVMMEDITRSCPIHTVVQGHLQQDAHMFVGVAIILVAAFIEHVAVKIVLRPLD